MQNCQKGFDRQKYDLSEQSITKINYRHSVLMRKPMYMVIPLAVRIRLLEC